MKKIKTLLFAALAATFVLQSCTNDDEINDSENQLGTFKNGIFVLNEGAMGNNNAEVTFYKDGITFQQIFKTKNPTLNLGNVAQSILFEDDLAFIVVNGSNKIEVVDSKSFQSKTTITSNLNNPRYAEEDDNYLYVSNWGDPSNPSDDYIAIYRLSDYAFVKKIDVAEGPEQILVENNKLIIAHSGGWSNGNSVTIYNLLTNTKQNLVVGDIPSALVEENNQVFVLCSGITWGGTPSAGKLVKINLNTNQISQSIDFAAGENPRFLVKDSNNKLYYTLENKVYQTNTNVSTLPQSELFTSDATYIYSFNVINNAIYVGDAKDFASNGEVKYYNIAGTYLGKFSTGIGPNFITFH